MTLTTLDPGAAPPTPSQRASERSPSPHDRHPHFDSHARASDAYAEVALAMVTMAAVLGFGRLFSDWSFLFPALAAALVAHALASGCRRIGLAGVWAALVSVGGLGLFLAWVFEPGTTVLGLPGGATWTAVHDELSRAWNQFATVVAPTPTTAGFTMAAATGAWVTAWLADTFAFRARVRLEALVPSFTLFLFGAMLGADRHRILVAGAYLAAVIAFALTAGGATRPGYSWFGGRGPGHRAKPGAAFGDPGRMTRRVGTAIGLVAVVGAVVIGPHLPGVDADALVSLQERDKDSDSSRVTVSPLVDIRGRLVEQSDTEAFTVASATATYWRLTSLDRFDGSIWSSKGNYRRARGSLADGPATAAAETTLRQDFTVSSLSSIWLPAAYRPERLVSRVGGLRYDAGTASLLTDQASSDGLSYTIESSLPRFTADELAAVSAPIPTDITESYLDLPVSFPNSVRAIARRAVAPASRPYEMARALQDWFRDNFTYSLDVPAGHGNRAIEDFLDRREGYCEQFAGTYAAMARSLGLPARVAVGFTSGSRGADGLFRVAGRNAHAWPEVYIAGYGWVAFEPTPGRGMPGAEDYTGVAAPPDSPPQAEPETGADPAVEEPGSVPTTVPAESGQGPTAQEPPPEASTESTTDDTNRSVLSGALFWLGLVAAVLAVAVVAGVPAAKRAKRARRRAAATTPSAQVLAAWQDADDDLAMMGLSRFRTETLAEHARRAAASTAGERHSSAGQPVVDTRIALADLASAATAATWSPAGVPDEAAPRARAAADTVMQGVKAMTTRLERVRWALDPRPLLRRRP